jgi:hypothetical protein
VPGVREKALDPVDPLKESDTPDPLRDTPNPERLGPRLQLCHQSPETWGTVRAEQHFKESALVVQNG